MKFVVRDDLRSNRFFSFLLLFFSLMMFLFLCLNPFYEKSKWGLTPAEISTSISGNADNFIPAMTLMDLITNIHIELFLYLFLITMLLLVFFRTKTPQTIKFTLSLFLLFSCLSNTSSPFLIHFSSGYGAEVKFFSFWSMTSFSLIILLKNIKYLCGAWVEQKNA